MNPPRSHRTCTAAWHRHLARTLIRCAAAHRTSAERLLQAAAEHEGAAAGHVFRARELQDDAKQRQLAEKEDA